MDRSYKWKLKNPNWVYNYNRKPERRFYISKWCADKRHQEWSLTFEDYENLINKSCTYCGGAVENGGSGLDRVNNSLGYSLDNVVPCCQECNRIKGNKLSFHEMKQVAKLLVSLRRGVCNVG